MKRRIISILTALALCLTLLPPTALAQSTGTVTITGTDPATPVTLEDGKFYVINEESSGGVTAQGTAPESGAYLTYANGVMTVHGTNGTILFLYGQLAMSGDLTIKYAGDENFVVESEGSSPALALNGHTLTLDAGMGLIVVNKNENASCPPVDTGTIRFADKPYTYEGSIEIMSHCEAASGALTVENAGYVNIIGTTASGPVIDNLTVRNCDMVEVSQHSETNTTLSNVVGNITTDRTVFLYVGNDENMAGIITPVGEILECKGNIKSTLDQGIYKINSTVPVLYQAGRGIVYYEPATANGGKAVLTLDNAYSDKNILISGTTRGTAGSLELKLNGENEMQISAYFPTTLKGTGSFDGVLEVSEFNNNSTGALNAVVRVGASSYTSTVYGERNASDSGLRAATFSAGASLTIAQGAKLTVNEGETLILDNSDGVSLKNHGTIINNGTIAITAAVNAQDEGISEFIKGLNLTGSGLVEVGKGQSQVGGSKDTYTNAGVKMLDPVEELDLSNKTTGEDKLDTQGYKWEVTKGTDGSGNEVITSGKLTLAPGFNAEKVTLPDAEVEIETEGDGRIGELVGYDIKGRGPQKTKLTFSGEGTLTINERINLAGGSGNGITVADKAKVTANKGIYVGATGESSVTVHGILNASGYYDGSYNVPAVSAGKVAIETTGDLEVSGAQGVLLNGMSGVFTNLFTVTGDGCFTADCPEYNVMVVASGSFAEGTTAEGAISLGKEYMPDDCKAELKNKEINLVRISTGEVYTGPITIHQNHDWKDTWSIDQNNHWHACTFAGCDKKQQGSEAAHTPSDWIVDQAATVDAPGSKHKECTVCRYKTETVEIPKLDETHEHSYSWVHNSSEHWKECECGDREGAAAAHSLTWKKDGSEHWQECSVCGYSTAKEAHVFDSGSDRTCDICGYTRRIDGGASGGGGGVYSYTVTVEESEGGSVAADRRTAFSGETVALTVIPEEGYELQSIAAADIWGSEVKLAEDGGRYTFTMPSRDVTVTAVFAPSAPKPCDGGEDCPSRAFTDLATVGSWYHEAVDYVLEKGLMDGYGNGTFGPDDSLSRGQLARILYNLEGRPAPEGQSPFPDVREGKWYTAAIAWAAERKVVLGYDDGTFGPNDPVTREQLAAMLWRYGGRPLAVNEELDFADAGKVSAYAREALRWAVEQGVVQGKGGGVLDPKGSATRAEAAAMLMRFLEK